MIRAIETSFKGYRFRSRLKARWAVFFDTCGFRWEYEPEGYEIDGLRHLPDFRLYDVKCRNMHDEGKPFFVEAKGNIDEESRKKIEALSRSFPVYVVGPVPYGVDGEDYIDSCCDENEREDYFYSYLTVDGDDYPAILFRDRDGRPRIAGPDHWSDRDMMDEEGTIRALKAARAARFEKGGWTS